MLVYACRSMGCLYLLNIFEDVKLRKSPGILIMVVYKWAYIWENVTQNLDGFATFDGSLTH
jgi:hypothetical protein